MADDLGVMAQGFLNSPIAIPIILVLVGLAVMWKMGIRLSSNVKTINRPEIIRQKLIKTLQMNRGVSGILEQDKNKIGFMSNIGHYDLGKKKLYLFLYSPFLFWNVPKFWQKDVMIVSDEYLVLLDDHKPKIKIWGLEIGTDTLKSWLLKSDFFLDNFSLVKLNLGDSDALDFVNMKLKLDEIETESGAYLAQAMRLSSVDFSKAYEPTKQDIEMERLQQAQEGKQ